MIKKLENRKWKVLKSTPLLNCGPWLNIRQELVELPSGAQIPTWFVMHFPNWINVIAITRDGQFVIEDQYRHALGETHYELVAGVIDEGETPLQAAQRELSEETGFGGGEWQLFMTLSPNPTNHTNLSYTFLATGVEKLTEQHQERTFVPVWMGLCGIAYWFLSRFVNIEYEYRIIQGEFQMDIIYGQRQRKELMSCRVRDMEIIHPLDDAGKAALASCSHVDDCSISQKKPTPDVYYFTYTENGKKYGLVFEATKKTLDIMKFYNASALTFSDTLRH